MNHLHRDADRAFRRLSIGIIVIFVLVVCLLAGCALLTRADAHWTGDNDPALHAWFEKLASGNGLCCSFADGVKIEDPDVDTRDGHYLVRLDGRWIVVPDAALVTEPNKFGPAVVWPYQDASGTTQIRCFIPGSGA